MKIELLLETDNHNSTPHESLELRRGVNRPDNIVINLGDRQIEVKMRDLLNAVNVLAQD